MGGLRRGAKTAVAMVISPVYFVEMVVSCVLNAVGMAFALYSIRKGLGFGERRSMKLLRLLTFLLFFFNFVRCIDLHGVFGLIPHAVYWVLMDCALFCAYWSLLILTHSASKGCYLNAMKPIPPVVERVGRCLLFVCFVVDLVLQVVMITTGQQFLYGLICWTYAVSLWGTTVYFVVKMKELLRSLDKVVRANSGRLSTEGAHGVRRTFTTKRAISGPSTFEFRAKIRKTLVMYSFMSSSVALSLSITGENSKIIICTSMTILILQAYERR